jgi:hypothetical protein
VPVEDTNPQHGGKRRGDAYRPSPLMDVLTEAVPG